MAAKSWNLLDVDRDVYVDELNVGAKDVPGAPAGFSIRKWTHQGGTSRGVDEIRINNGSLEVSLLPRLCLCCLARLCAACRPARS